MLVIRLPKSAEDRLNRIARRTGHTKSDIAREAISIHLPAFEKLATRKKLAPGKSARTPSAKRRAKDRAR